MNPAGDAATAATLRNLASLHAAQKTLGKAAAEYLRSAFADEDEIAEVVASHLVEAYRAAPDDSGATELKAQASAALVRAGERAKSLAATAEAARYLGQAAELTDDAAERAKIERARSIVGMPAVELCTERR